MKLPFFGGVHPDGHKDLSAAAPLAAMPPPARVAIPLRQHIGAPCKPLVKAGDAVRMGQKIGDGEGLCVPVHASVSGVGHVDTVILNACECEPYITADDMLMRTRPGDVLRGLAVFMRILAPGETVAAVEDNKPQAVEALKQQLPKTPGIQLKVLPTRYPQGAEKQLIQAVTGRQAPSGGLPRDVGCAVFNAASAAAVCRAVYEGVSVYERIVTVTGEGVKQPRNLIVRVGTSFQEVIDAAGGLTDDVWKVLSGGPMMGIAQSSLSVPVTKATNAVLCLSNAQNGESGRPVCRCICTAFPTRAIWTP